MKSIFLTSHEFLRACQWFRQTKRTCGIFMFLGGGVSSEMHVRKNSPQNEFSGGVRCRRIEKSYRKSCDFSIRTRLCNAVRVGLVRQELYRTEKRNDKTRFFKPSQLSHQIRRRRTTTKVPDIAKIHTEKSFVRAKKCTKYGMTFRQISWMNSDGLELP